MEPSPRSRGPATLGRAAPASAQELVERPGSTRRRRPNSSRLLDGVPTQQERHERARRRRSGRPSTCSISLPRRETRKRRINRSGDRVKERCRQKSDWKPHTCTRPTASLALGTCGGHVSYPATRLRNPRVAQPGGYEGFVPHAFCLAMEVMERAFALEREGRGCDPPRDRGARLSPPPRPSKCLRSARSPRARPATPTAAVWPSCARRSPTTTERRTAHRHRPGAVLVTSGTSPAMLLVFSLLVEPGDEVSSGRPTTPATRTSCASAAASPCSCPDRRRGYRLDPTPWRAALTPRTRAIVVSSPPTRPAPSSRAETLARAGRAGRAARQRRDLRRARLRRGAGDLGARVTPRRAPMCWTASRSATR